MTKTQAKTLNAAIETLTTLVGDLEGDYEELSDADQDGQLGSDCQLTLDLLENAVAELQRIAELEAKR
jgi:hypothetical protein